MEEKLARIKQLIELKENTDAELETLINGGDMRSRKPPRCSHCNEEGHTSRNCPSKTV